MKVRFIRHSLEGLPLSHQAVEHYHHIYTQGGPYGSQNDLGGGLLHIGYEATVYALSITECVTRYFIREPKHGSITHFAAPAFDIVDGRVSSYWHYQRKIIPETVSVFPKPATEHALFAIQEWIEEPRFHEGVVEGWERETAIMEAKAAMMDNEFN